MSVTHSLRWRLQLWHGAILALVLVGFGVPAYLVVKESRRTRLEQDLQRLNATIAGAMRPSIQRAQAGFPPPPPDVRLSDDQRAMFGEDSGFYYAVYLRDGRMISSGGPVPQSLLPPREEDDDRPVVMRTRAGWREMVHFTPRGEFIVTGRAIGQLDAEDRRLAWILTGVGATVLLLGLGAGWFLTDRAIRPIDAISETAARISAGNLNERINHTQMDRELGALAIVLNETFSRLDAAFARQTRFTGDAAHELRTPLSVILSQAQLALRSERSAADYREALEACERAAQRMRNLTESLLVLSRLDAHPESIPSAPCDLAEIARESTDLLQPLASEHGVILRGEFFAAPTSGDRQSLGQVVTNLITNALQHSASGREVCVRTKANGTSVSLEVVDQGTGIAPKHLPHLFDRFYRADESRNRRTGGAGLGLAICKAIADAHRATLEATSVYGQGATFTLRMRRSDPVLLAKTVVS